jgi:hypothetical protein
MKYEFLSRPWFAALHAIICEKALVAAKSDPNFSFSICEVFVGAPAELVNTAGGKTAWHAIVRGATVEFGLAERDDVDFKAIADYAKVVPLARYDTMDRPERVAELQSMALALTQSGGLTAIGNPPSANGGPMAKLHDAIAQLTR